MPGAVRRMAPGDAALLKSLRLRMLSEAPIAFGSTYEREAAFGDDVWIDRLQPSGHPHFVALDGLGAAVGMAAVVPHEVRVRVAHLVGMWVESAARGTGVADALIAAAVRHARTDGSTTMVLWVVAGNSRAQGCYERHAFSRTGLEEQRERDGVIEIEMARDLTAAR